MKAADVREKYLKFFESKGHKRITPAPVIPVDDPTTLFTSSGMQQLVPYLMGEKHPLGKRLVDSQPLFRAHGANSDDIEEVGDNRHLTYFEMLGNWSLGDYFKKEQLNWFFEFLTSKEEGLNLDPNKLFVSVFEGNNLVPKDIESIKIWQEIFSKIGIDAKVSERIFTYPAKKNWWSRSGTPDEMPVGEIGGPDSEVFYDFGESLKLHEKSPWKNEKCHPNCDCGRFLEIGNSVFMQYKKTKEGLEELPNKNVDFGGGLERLTAAANGDPDIYKIDIFWPTIEKIQKVTNKNYEDNLKPMRIIADHIRASEFLVKQDITPSNKLQGYVLRRLIRRVVVNFQVLKKDFSIKDFEKITNNKIILDEISKFQKALTESFKELNKKAEIFKNKKEADILVKNTWEQYKKDLPTISKELSLTPQSTASLYAGTVALGTATTYGLPIQESINYATNLIPGSELSETKKIAQYGYELHRDLSRTQSAGVFKGGLADHSEEVTKLHTATHLLHASLRKILGTHVSQKGSNITSERLRFDFTHPAKLTDDEKKKVEDLVNEQIAKKLPVAFEIMSLDDAEKQGALHFFNERYGDKVKVYSIGTKGETFSREVCGGPHVKNTSELGNFKIIKEEAAGAGIRRIYAKFQ